MVSVNNMDELIAQINTAVSGLNVQREDKLSLLVLLTEIWYEFKKAADAIEELQKQLREEKVDNVNLTGWLAEEHAKHLWIPVTERLPEKYDRVLVYSKATRMGRSIDFINADGNWYTTPKVSHWMPLPQPPKDGES